MFAIREKKRGKVVVAMSGGVDSSVAAALLQRQGYECIGVFMRLGHEPEEEDQAVCKTDARKANRKGCCSVGDAADARYVAGLLGMEFYALNFRSDFGRIVDYFVQEYNAGRTPNPCVRCNEYLKFGKLARYARALDADFVATGHYARIGQTPTRRPAILRGADIAKDQSYVLFGVPPEELPRMLLPIGDYPKKQVREMAQEMGLPVHSKPDSQEICFVPDNNYFDLVARRSPQSVKPGQFIGPNGDVVGEHPGHQRFTIGQRKGVGVALGYPIYVTAIDSENNRVHLGPAEELLSQYLTAGEVNWLDDELPNRRRCLAKVRYNSQPAPATVSLSPQRELVVEFDEPIAAITPGQAVVCYEDARVLGGGWIQKISRMPPAK
ncbi:MAG: tRNA 2-thiouridine(34) synthase MnmA [Phycisphaerae bacterium]